MEPGKSTTLLEGRERRSKEQGGAQLLSFLCSFWQKAGNLENRTVTDRTASLNLSAYCSYEGYG